MFIDKTVRRNGTVSTVQRFFSSPGVKNGCTVDTVHSSAAIYQPKEEPDGQVIEMRTVTGTWYYNMRLTEPSVLGWTRELSKAYIYAPSSRSVVAFAQKAHDDMVALAGEGQVLGVRVLPVRKTPIGRCEIIEGES